MPSPEQSGDSARRPYKGSCHCGFTKYIIYLQFPPLTALPATREDGIRQVRLRKCNCSTCHKMGFFHVRVPFAPKDFMLLSPTDPLNQLSDYTCFEKKCHWLFCKDCGVRCFAFIGEGEITERDVNGEKKTVWALKEEGYAEGQGSYLSVNAQTLEPGQEGLDLKEWHEKKWVAYLDCLDEMEDDRWSEPHRGGTY